MSHDMTGRCGGRRGALTEPVVLAALQRESAHGYDLRAAISGMTGGEISVDAGGLYRTLRRLEDDGFVTSRWVDGDSGPQRRDYSITAEGWELAADWAHHLEERARLLRMVAGLIDSAESPDPR